MRSIIDRGRVVQLAAEGKCIVEIWRHVLFTDEKTFELNQRPRNDYVYARSAADVPPHPTVKHPGKLHVWAGMSYYGTTELYCFTGNMDADFYLGMLEERLQEDARRIFGGRRWLFQQDGDPKHTAKRVQQWLANNRINYITKEQWPAQSPDLNPQEHMWAILQDRVYARQPRNLAQLERVLEDEWEKIDAGLLHSLIDSMPRRLAAVRAAEGGPTRY